MLKNYLKLGFRNLNKYKLSSFINITGLALAVGCCLMVFEYTYWATHQDNFNKKIDQLFVIEKVINKDGELKNYGDAPAPLGPMLKNDFPQIKNIARLNQISAVIKQNENVFRENLTFVDDAFYKMFDYPVKWGDEQYFTDKDGIVLTLELAEKLFGSENPVGKPLIIKFNIKDTVRSENFIIKGVLEKYPTEASFTFSALMPRSRMVSLGFDKPGDWTTSTSITFIQADDEQALSAVKTGSRKYSDLYNKANYEEKLSSFHFQPLKTMNFHSYKVARSDFSTMEPMGLIMLAVIAVSILLLVYFNYINITIASASNRLKEISVRKVMGSSKNQIIFQFIIENLIVCTIAVFFGLLLAEIFFFPWFSSVAGFELGKGAFSNSRTWITAFTLIIISALSGAIYPSFYISSLNTVSIMKGKNVLGSNNRFRKVLLAFQFLLTFISISTAIAFIQETQHIKDKPWGYQPKNNIVIPLDNSVPYTAIKEQFRNNKNVEVITGSVQSLGNYTREIHIKNEGKIQTVKSISILPGFISQLGIKITEGQDFNTKSLTGQSDAVIVNQAFLKSMNWSSGIGKKIVYNNHNYSIVGQVNDFHYESFEYKITPVILMSCKPEDVKVMYIKYAPNVFSKAPEEIKNTWQKLYPDIPFTYHYQEKVFDGYINDFSKVSKVLSVTSMLMTIISISGVFGLALIILGKKMKEISIRKVLGANIINVIFLIYKEFVFALGTAILIGLPLSVFLINNMFSQISSNSYFSILPILISVTALIGTTILSVTWHIIKAYKASVSQYLKDE